jgi:5-methylcytosine-specific restriction endonuclease McrA
VVPASRGGADEESNLCLSCRACNVRKSDHLVFRDDVTGQEVALFNPREHRWTDHFQVDLDSAEIHGTTPTGRATLACLDLNNALQLSARQLWIRLRIFPG